MSFRARITLAAAAAVAVAVAAGSLVTYLVTRNALYDQVDAALREQAAEARVVPAPGGGWLVRLPAARFGSPSAAAQIVPADEALAPPPAGGLPVSARDRAIARGGGDAYFEDDTIEGVHVRVFTTQVIPGLAVRFARSLADTDQTLSRLRLILLVVGLSGIAVAVGLGLVVARTALAPVQRLTGAAERVTVTRDLSERIDTHGEDELSRLASSFNTMLEALSRSVGAQRQLVADASHELRTPLTSLRTNLEVLSGGTRISPSERKRLLADVVAQLDELGRLVGDLVELARDGEREQELTDVRLDLLVEEAVVRVGRRHPETRFDSDLEPTVVRGAAPRLDRAVTNLLENAAAWSPDGEQVSVTVRDGSVAVRDRGPGIADEDLPHVFERFYRASTARGKPGSGLGLAIVRQVAEAHGGRATVERAEGGGALVRLELEPAGLLANS
jgi:two-component system, OmpR family, sensor histidine kinase MprB